MADDDVRVALLGDVTVGTTQDANFQAALGGNRLALLERHGVVVAGVGRELACFALRDLEAACWAQYEARAAGKGSSKRGGGAAARAGAADLGGRRARRRLRSNVAAAGAARSCAATPSRRATRCGSSAPSTAAGPSSTARAAPTARRRGDAGGGGGVVDAARRPRALPGGALAVAFDAAAGRCAVATESGLALVEADGVGEPAGRRTLRTARRGARRRRLARRGPRLRRVPRRRRGDDALARAAVHAVAAGAAPFAEDGHAARRRAAPAPLALVLSTAGLLSLYALAEDDPSRAAPRTPRPLDALPPAPAAAGQTALAGFAAKPKPAGFAAAPGAAPGFSFGAPAAAAPGAAPAFGFAAPAAKAPDAAPPSRRAKAPSGYPPMATKAPSKLPFGAPAPAAKAPSGYPPMATKAPSKLPFGARRARAKAPSGYPPMATKAPSKLPFGAPAPAPAAKAPSGYPPMATKAPSKLPFGAPRPLRRPRRRPRRDQRAFGDATRARGAAPAAATLPSFKEIEASVGAPAGGARSGERKAYTVPHDMVVPRDAAEAEKWRVCADAKSSLEIAEGTLADCDDPEKKAKADEWARVLETQPLDVADVKLVNEHREKLEASLPKATVSSFFTSPRRTSRGPGVLGDATNDGPRASAAPLLIRRIKATYEASLRVTEVTLPDLDRRLKLALEEKRELERRIERSREDARQRPPEPAPAPAPPPAPAAPAPAPAFGAAPPAPPPAATDYKARIVALYAKHAPDKVGNVDALLAKYAGREAELAAKIEANRAAPAAAALAPATPFGTAPAPAQPTSMFTPSKGAGSGGLFAPGGPARAGRGAAGRRRLRRAARRPSAPRPRPRRHWSPRPLPSGRRRGARGGVALRRRRRRRSAPRPRRGAVRVGAAPAPAFGGLGGGGDARAKITDIYRRCNPSKLGEVDKLLAARREAELLQRLQQIVLQEPRALAPLGAAALGASASGGRLRRLRERRDRRRGGGAGLRAPSQPGGFGAAPGGSARRRRRRARPAGGRRPGAAAAPAFGGGAAGGATFGAAAAQSSFGQPAAGGFGARPGLWRAAFGAAAGFGRAPLSSFTQFRGNPPAGSADAGEEGGHARVVVIVVIVVTRIR
ncbi:hypothetical protein JL720_3385 [Aureococcus anophagefferens]|nr:hypothetical protein JL720_3385 [Aureococcus anophagefferens]